jgi:chromosome segregation ATPase
MYDTYYGLATYEVLAIVVGILLAIWLLYRLLLRSSDDAETANPAPGPERPIAHPHPPKPGSVPQQFASLDELKTLRSQLDSEVLARLAAEKKLADESIASAPLHAEVSDLKRLNSDLAVQNNDLLRRLDKQQEDQMSIAGRLNDEIVNLKRQLEQSPAPALISSLQGEIDQYKRTGAELALQNNDLLRRLDKQQEDQMSVVARLNDEISQLQRKLEQTPGPQLVVSLQSEVQALKSANSDLTLQNNDLVRRLDTQQEDQMAVTSKLNAEIAALKSDVLRASSDAKGVMDGVNNLVWEFIAPPIPHLQGSETADGQLGKLRTHLQTVKNGGADLQTRLTQVQDQLSSAMHRVAALDAEIVGLRGQLAKAPPDLSGEVRSLKDQLNQLQRDRDSAREAERVLTDRLRLTEHDLSQARGGMEELGRLSAERQDEIQRLNLQLASMPNVEEYKRFKDALEAANRIASGQKA